jgi:hypothetical protein
MKWSKLWRRNSDDPLVKAFLDRYHLNLLSIPRENAAVGDLYVRNPNDERLSTPGRIEDFLVPTLEIPHIINDEIMADVSGQVSNTVSADLGLQFLEGFLNALGTQAVGTRIRAYFRSKNTKTMNFQFGNATRDYVNPSSLSLGGYKVKEENVLYAPGRRFYIVTGVARSNSISIIAQGENQKTLDMNAQAPMIAGGSANISVENISGGKVIFKGQKKLAFGVELYELVYNTVTKRLMFDLVTEAFSVRKGEETGTRKVMKPAFVGPTQESDIFIELE